MQKLSKKVLQTEVNKLFPGLAVAILYNKKHNTCSIEICTSWLAVDVPLPSLLKVSDLLQTVNIHLDIVASGGGCSCCSTPELELSIDCEDLGVEITQ